MRTHFTAVDPSVFRVESVEPMRLRMRLDAREEHLRPGGTISGPTLMMLADTATYLVCILGTTPASARRLAAVSVPPSHEPPRRKMRLTCPAK